MAQKTVRCHHCGHEMQVSTRAFSIGCPKCNQRFSVEDFTFSSPFAAARVETAGSIVIEPTGTLQARVKAKNLDLQGELDGNVVAQGKVSLSSDARLCGDITAQNLQVNPGAKIHGFCRIEPEHQDTQKGDNHDEPAFR
jgi:ribosomal protein S27E